MKSIYDKLLEWKLANLIEFEIKDKAKYYNGEWIDVEVEENEGNGIYIVKLGDKLIRTNKVLPVLTESILYQIVKQLADIFNIKVVVVKVQLINEGKEEIYISINDEAMPYTFTDLSSAYIFIIDVFYALIEKAKEEQNESEQNNIKESV